MNMILELLTYVIVVHWTVVSIYTLIGLTGYISYKKTYKTEEYEKTEICIISKARIDLKNTLFECIQHNSEILKEYRINIIIDDGSDLEEEIKIYTQKFENARLIVVAREFKCQAIAKGRAIEYFIRNYTRPDWWYAFIDDDNKILDRKFLREVSYYSKHGYAACNGLLYPRIGKSKLAFVADSVRYFDDLTIFRACTGLLKKPLNGFHGELLVAKGEILKLISFDRESITEDFAFARELIKNGYNTWQSETMVSIQSPHTLKDFIRQRNRWYRGISLDALSSDWKMKLFAGIRIIDWKIGLLGSWMIFPLWSLLPIPLWLSIFNMIGASYYYVSYIYGAMRLNELDGIKGIIFIPFYGMLETISPHMKVKNKKEFTVIAK